MMNLDQHKARFDFTARASGDAYRRTKVRRSGSCAKAGLAYGEGAANALGIPLGEVPKR